MTASPVSSRSIRLSEDLDLSTLRAQALHQRIQLDAGEHSSGASSLRLRLKPKMERVGPPVESDSEHEDSVFSPLSPEAPFEEVHSPDPETRSLGDGGDIDALSDAPPSEKPPPVPVFEGAMPEVEVDEEAQNPGVEDHAEENES
jgi:hypothetical protein